jgi:iron(II)-dependent oxidoreductase
MRKALTTSMCRVPAGIFHRGSAASPDEQPEGDVELSGYLIDETPVLNAAFAEFMRNGGYRKPPLWTPAGWAFVQAHQLANPN